MQAPPRKTVTGLTSLASDCSVIANRRQPNEGPVPSKPGRRTLGFARPHEKGGVYEVTPGDELVT